MAGHEAYDEALKKLFAVYSYPIRAVNRSTAEQIAAVVYEAATDGTDQVRYVAGTDAKMMYERRLTEGSEEFRKKTAQIFL